MPTRAPLPIIVRRRSRLHGYGVFAAEPINKNRRIIDYAGELVRNRDCAEREARYLEDGCIWVFRVNRAWSRDAAVGGNIARFINHACKPNCWFEVVGTTIWIRAARRIEAGEELTYDYATVVVNETLAKQQWPNDDAIGQRLTLTFSPNDEEPSREVVGVVADTIPFRGASEVPPLIYVLHRQQATEQRASLEGRRTVMSFIVRTSEDPLTFADALRAQVGKVDASTPVASIRSVESYLNAGQTALLQYAEMLLGIVALVALVAGAVAVYALTAYGVAHRQSLLALGLFVVTAAVIGTAAGWAGWMRIASVVESFLTNLSVAPADRMPLAVTAAITLATAFVVSLVGFTSGRALRERQAAES